MIFPPLGKNRERAPASIYIIDSDSIIDAPISPLKINRLIYSGHVATFPVLNFHEKSDGNHDFGRFMRPRVSRGRRLVNTGGTTQNASTSFSQHAVNALGTSIRCIANCEISLLELQTRTAGGFPAVQHHLSRLDNLLISP